MIVVQQKLNFCHPSTIGVNTMSYKVVLLSEVDICNFISGHHHVIPVVKRNVYDDLDAAREARTRNHQHQMKMLKIFNNGSYSIIM